MNTLNPVDPTRGTVKLYGTRVRSSQGHPTQVDTPDIGDKRSGRPAEWPWYTSCSQNDREQCLEARAGHDRASRKFVFGSGNNSYLFNDNRSCLIMP